MTIQHMVIAGSGGPLPDLSGVGVVGASAITVGALALVLVRRNSQAARQYVARHAR